MKNELSRTGIFDIHDWGEIINLNAFLGQINLAEQLQEKINKFKEEFIYSHTYSLKDLLENDNVCWLTFRYIPRDYYDVHYSDSGVSTESLENGYKGKIILRSLLSIKNCRNNNKSAIFIPRLWKRYSTSKSTQKFYSWCINSYKLVSSIKEEDNILKKLFLEELYTNNYFYSGSLRNIIKNNTIINFQYNGKDIKEYDNDIHQESQNIIIDGLGGSNFIEKLKNYTDNSINKLRSYYLKHNIDDDKRFVLSKYNQPILVKSRNSDVKLIAKNEMLYIIIENYDCDIPTYSFIYYQKPIIILKFSGNTGKMTDVFSTNDYDNIENEKQWTKLA